MTRVKRFARDAVRQVLYEKVNEHGLRAFAREIDFDPAVVSKVVNRHMDVTDKLARALGFEPCPTEYTRIK